MGRPSPMLTGLACRCPSCGKGPIFTGLLQLRPSCPVCGFDNAIADPGDGPAVFAILIVGAIITVAALVVELTFAPPYWLHLVLWLPAVLVLSVVSLRILKSLLFSLQVHHRAEEARPDGPARD